MDAHIYIEIDVGRRSGRRSRHYSLDIGWLSFRWWVRNRVRRLGVRLGIIDPPDYNFSVPNLAGLLYELTPGDVPLATWQRAFGEETENNEAS